MTFLHFLAIIAHHFLYLLPKNLLLFFFSQLHALGMLMSSAVLPLQFVYISLVNFHATNYSYMCINVGLLQQKRNKPKWNNYKEKSWKIVSKNRQNIDNCYVWRFNLVGGNWQYVFPVLICISTKKDHIDWLNLVPPVKNKNVAYRDWDLAWVI